MNAHTAFAAAERTPWLHGKRIRRYNPTLTLLLLLIAVTSAIPLLLTDIERLWPIALLLFLSALIGLVLLGRRAIRGVRLNNGAAALMTRGEDLGASGAFKSVIGGFFGRDIVAMSLHNLGVLALRSLDLSSAIALHRAAIAASWGFRFRWQPNLAGELARAQLAFALAARGTEAELIEAAAVLERAPRATSAMVIAFRVRAHALIAARQGHAEDVVEILDGERELLRNVLPFNDAVLCEAMTSVALARLGNTYRGAARASMPILADDLARDYVRSILPEAESVLVSG